MAHMTQSLLARSAGPVAIIAGALVVVTRVVIMVTTPADIDALTVYVLSTTHAINGVASIVAFAMLVFALVASYDLQARAAGVLGVIGLGAAILGTVFMAGDWWYEAFAVPRLAEVAQEVMATFASSRLLLGGLTSFVLFGIGWVLYGIASVRARVFPAAVSWSILAGGLLSGVPIGLVYLPGSVILGLAFVALGVWWLRSPPLPLPSNRAGITRRCPAKAIERPWDAPMARRRSGMRVWWCGVRMISPSASISTPAGAAAMPDAGISSSTRATRGSRSKRWRTTRPIRPASRATWRP